MNLIIVAGHCVFKEGCTGPVLVEREDSREGGFPGEGRLYRDHVKAGVLRAEADAAARLYFSGGQTKDNLPGRSEALSYYELARDHGWFGCPEVAARAHCEEFSRDSFENLLFSIAQFQHDAGQLPQHVTFIGWAFKARRLQLHCEALNWPLNKFEYLGVNNPAGADLEKAEADEERLVAVVINDPRMEGPQFQAKRAARNPFRRQSPYSMVL